MGYRGVLLDDLDDAVSKEGITACELVREGRKDVSEHPPVEEIAGAEKASTEYSIVGESF